MEEDTPPPLAPAGCSSLLSTAPPLGGSQAAAPVEAEGGALGFLRVGGRHVLLLRPVRAVYCQNFAPSFKESVDERHRRGHVYQRPPRAQALAAQDQSMLPAVGVEMYRTVMEPGRPARPLTPSLARAAQVFEQRIYASGGARPPPSWP